MGAAGAAELRKGCSRRWALLEQQSCGEGDHGDGRCWSSRAAARVITVMGAAGAAELRKGWSRARRCALLE
eukprot:366494-Chlamydomonas_euryale.AAC.9